MTTPLRISFDVACPADHAFQVWTSGIGTWWPPDHTVSGGPEHIVLTSGVGGRIYERSADGTEHEWGEVTVWQPPTRLVYLWYLGRDRADATEVEIRFQAQGGHTRVDIEHRGWDRVGEQWRDRTRIGWQTLLPHYQKEIAHGRWH
jgi:Activator of Hsp90 ATPase homolog 1-like protein